MAEEPNHFLVSDEATRQLMNEEKLNPDKHPLRIKVLATVGQRTKIPGIEGIVVVQPGQIHVRLVPR